MDLSDTDEEESMKNPVPQMPPRSPSPLLKESSITPQSSAGPPPPPPPPPPLPSVGAAPSSVSQDGVGQMTLMAKSKMHDELIRKAKLKELQESVSSSALSTTPGPPPPPPPPPPPMIAAPDNVSQDGVGQMTMMAKSKMHDELIKKAKLKEPPIPGPPPPPPPPAPTMVAAPDNVSQDGVGQMTMMAKSRMHDELIKKARRDSIEEEKSQRQATPPSPPLHPPGLVPGSFYSHCPTFPPS